MWLVKYKYLDGEVFNGFGGFTLPLSNNYMFGITEQPDGYEIIDLQTVESDRLLKDVVQVLLFAYYYSTNRILKLMPDGSLSEIVEERQKLDFVKQIKLNELKNYTFNLLTSTDWAVIKCQELGLSKETVYPDIIEKRQKIRQWNNEVEGRIINAMSLEEFDIITSKFK